MKERMLKLLRLVALVLVAMLVGSVGAAAGPADGNSGEGGGQGQLEEHKVRARPVFEIEGVVFTDADETRNLLVVGVVNKGLANAVERRLKQLGIPLSSVEIVETKPIVFVTTLQDNGPPEGGLQVAFVDGGLAYLCTLGFNAVRAGVNGFVVNSHCTTDQFKVDGTNHYQPWLSPSSNLIGNEIADPPSFKCDVKGKKCRYSDAAYDQLADNVLVTDVALGSIARPDGINTGSLTIDTPASSFTITAEAAGNVTGGTATVGTILNKVGRTTGWTQGPVTNSCVDTGVFRTNILLLCQDFVDAGVGGGDSGSPVFEITTGTDVTLNGILWGGASDGSFFVYSPIFNIEKELGELTTFGPPPTDTTAPTLVTATVDSTSLVLAYDEDLDPTSVPAIGDFSIVKNAAAQSPTLVAISGTAVTLTLDPGVANGDTVTVSYTAGQNPIRDIEENDAVNLVDQGVMNNTPALDTTAPTLDSATVDSTSLVLAYDEDLDPNSVPAPGDFSIFTDGSAVIDAGTAVVVSGTDVTLTLSPGVASGDTVTVSYMVPDVNPIQDLAENDAAAFTNRAVTNNTAAAGGPVVTKIVLEVSQKGPNIQATAKVYAAQDSVIDGDFFYPDGGTFLNSDNGTVGGRGFAKLDSDKVQNAQGIDTFTIKLTNASGITTCLIQVDDPDGAETCE